MNRDQAFSVRFHSAVKQGTSYTQIALFFLAGLLAGLWAAGLTEQTALAQTHNTWTSGAPMPTAVQCPATAVVKGKVYVIGGATNSSIVNINQIYNPAKNKWTTGAPMPTARACASAVEYKFNLYVIGGNTGSGQTGVVEEYNPQEDSWTEKSPMPIPSQGLVAIRKGEFSWAMGGYNSTDGLLDSIQYYDFNNQVWFGGRYALPDVRSSMAAGLLGSQPTFAEGLDNGGVTGDTEFLDIANWRELPVGTARQGGCFATIDKALYITGGTTSSGSGSGGPVNVLESINLKTQTWATLAPAPLAQVNPGGAEAGGVLYCFGGSDNGELFQGTVYDNVQIYTP